MDDIPEFDASASNTNDADENMDDEDNMHYSELIRFLTQSSEMRTTAKSAVKQSLWTGGGTFLGAVLGGPIGGLIGGVGGSIVGFLKSADYDGALLQVIKLEGERRKKLMMEVGQVLTLAGATARQLESADQFRAVLCQYAERSSVRDGIWRACLNSLREN